MKLVDFIVCDDIRDELHNKVTLVGIYNDRININTADRTKLMLPAFMPCLAVYCRIDLEDESLKSRVRLCKVSVKANTTVVFENTLHITDQRDRFVLIKIRMAPFLLHEGETLFDFTLFESAEKILFEVPTQRLLVQVNETQPALTAPGNA